MLLFKVTCTFFGKLSSIVIYVAIWIVQLLIATTRTCTETLRLTNNTGKLCGETNVALSTPPPSPLKKITQVLISMPF